MDSLPSSPTWPPSTACFSSSTTWTDCAINPHWWDCCTSGVNVSTKSYVWSYSTSSNLLMTFSALTKSFCWISVSYHLLKLASHQHTSLMIVNVIFTELLLSVHTVQLQWLADSPHPNLPLQPLLTVVKSMYFLIFELPRRNPQNSIHEFPILLTASVCKWSPLTVGEHFDVPLFPVHATDWN